MAPYLVGAFLLVVALTPVLLFPDAVSRHLKRLSAWVIPSLPSGTGPSFGFRVCALLGAYFAAACIVFFGGKQTFDNPLQLALGLFVFFPFGLARFFNWNSTDYAHLIYLVLTVQLIIPNAKAYWALFGTFVLLLCFNVRGCFEPII